MPTLIRLLIVLLVLAGVVFGGMVALTMTVDPGEKDMTIRIPRRDLVAPPPNNDPLGINVLPAPVNIVPRPQSSAESAPVSTLLDDPQADDEGIVTIAPGPAE